MGQLGELCTARRVAQIRTQGRALVVGGNAALARVVGEMGVTLVLGQVAKGVMLVTDLGP